MSSAMYHNYGKSLMWKNAFGEYILSPVVAVFHENDQEFVVIRESDNLSYRVIKLSTGETHS